MNNLNITLDMTRERFVELFGPQKVDAKLFDTVIWVKINGNEVRMTPVHYFEDCQNPYYPKVQVILVPWIDKEIKAAEESVAKAKEALKAAMDTLQVLRDKK